MVRLAEPVRPLFPYLKPVYSLATEALAPLSLLASRARGGHLPRGSARTLEDAAASSGGRSWTLRAPEEVVRGRALGHPAAHPSFLAAERELIGRVALAELPRGRVLGPHAAVITGDDRLVLEVSHYFGIRRPRQHPLYLNPSVPEPVDVDGDVAVLAYQGSAVNYYHFLTDTLPRVALIEQCAAIEPPEWFYVPAGTPARAGLLDRIGIPAARRIDSMEVEHLRARRLLVPGLAGTEQHPPWVTSFLRSRLLGGGQDERVPGRFLYVSRGTSKNNRAVLNETELLEVLAARGFSAVDPGALSIDEQIRLFAEADVVVGAHGAALANVIFMSPGALVIELFPAAHAVPLYWKLAQTVPGLGYRYLCGRGSARKPDRTRMLVSDITVDVPALLAMLDQHRS